MSLFRESLPVTVIIGSGREHEGRKLIPLMESIRIRPGRRRGRPRKRPSVLHADTKYDMPLNRFYLDGSRCHTGSILPQSNLASRIQMYDLPRLPCMDKSEVNQAVVKFTYFAIFRDGRLQEPAADS